MTVYVITGARAGIGLGCVRQLAQVPTNTIFALVRSLTGDLSALHTIQAQTPADGATIHILECDMSSAPSMAALPTLLRTATSNPDLQIDVLINNAAILHSRASTALNLAPEILVSHITTNVLGPALLLQSLLPLLAPSARVANISSGIASLSLVHSGRVNAEFTPYSISKAALNMLTVHQARQVREGVVVVAVDPGHVKTEMGAEGAVVEVEDSAKGILAVVAGLGEGDRGRFFGYTGEEVAW